MFSKIKTRVSSSKQNKNWTNIGSLSFKSSQKFHSESFGNSRIAHFRCSGTPSCERSLNSPSFLLAFCLLLSFNCCSSLRRSNCFIKLPTSSDRQWRGLITRSGESSSDSSDEMRVEWRQVASRFSFSSSSRNFSLVFSFCKRKKRKKG